jgi:hypothetical protein
MAWFVSTNFAGPQQLGKTPRVLRICYGENKFSLRREKCLAPGTLALDLRDLER